MVTGVHRAADFQQRGGFQPSALPADVAQVAAHTGFHVWTSVCKIAADIDLCFRGPIMKKLLMFLAIGALPAAAQWNHFGDPELRPTGYFGVGASVPVNPIASRLNTGWNLAGGGGVRYGFFGFTID